MVRERWREREGRWREVGRGRKRGRWREGETLGWERGRCNGRKWERRRGCISEISARLIYHICQEFGHGKSGFLNAGIWTCYVLTPLASSDSSLANVEYSQCSNPNLSYSNLTWTEPGLDKSGFGYKFNSDLISTDPIKLKT